MPCVFYNGSYGCDADYQEIDSDYVRNVCLLSDSNCQSCPRYNRAYRCDAVERWENDVGSRFDEYDDTRFSRDERRRMNGQPYQFHSPIEDDDDDDDEIYDDDDDDDRDGEDSRYKENSFVPYVKKDGTRCISRTDSRFSTNETFIYPDYDEVAAVKKYSEGNPLVKCPFRSENYVCRAKKGQDYFGESVCRKVREAIPDYAFVQVDRWGKYYSPGTWNGKKDYQDKYKNDICNCFSRAITECPYFTRTEEQELKYNNLLKSRRKKEISASTKRFFIRLLFIVILLAFSCTIGAIIEKSGLYRGEFMMQSVSPGNLFFNPLPWKGMLFTSALLFAAYGVGPYWVVFFAHLIFGKDKDASLFKAHVILLLILEALILGALFSLIFDITPISTFLLKLIIK